MLQFVRTLYYSFPVQLLILHFRKFQVLLIFWIILFSTITGNFMKTFGADALFLAPEYLGNVNGAAAAIVGAATGILVMSWNITTFILHSKRCRFLVTTARPFLKYCINNSIIPLLFLIIYFVSALAFDIKKELIPSFQFLLIAAGFFAGFILLIAFSFVYFFGADKRIVKTVKPIAKELYRNRKISAVKEKPQLSNYRIRVGYYLDAQLKLRKARDVTHYGEDFLDMIFKRHHFSAMISVLVGFVAMILIGFFLDHKIFQVPAAASVLLLFALMIAVVGALTYFLQTWSVLFLILLFFTLDLLYRYDIIDPRNKAYGINYIEKKDRPAYTLENLLQLSAPDKMQADKKNMVQVLNNWKARQGQEKPEMVFINFSGGGVRSASFAMSVLQHLDSLTNGEIMKKTFMMSGASGGILSAAYFRELYRQKSTNKHIDLTDPVYLDNISGDLLNPVFSSMIARDLLAPAQHFTFGPYRYVKDRGYAFEQKLNDNTLGVLNKTLGDYASDEKAATIPMIIFNSMISRDGRKLMISTQPVSYLMQPGFMEEDSSTNTDAVDFSALFSKQDPSNLRILTALRMNATFPYVLPNVWLPSDPIIDVMDAGMRDNYGQETTLRFLHVFKDWIRENTSGVLLIQVRDRKRGGWEKPFVSNDITGVLTKPGTALQYNWFKLQDYFQDDQMAYARSFLDSSFHRITFMFVPENEEKGVALNFHITAREKKEVLSSMRRPNNIQALMQVKKFIYRQ
ncbi:MAG: patatin-like phospholipase family protein [Ginsengibacter sp.]